MASATAWVRVCASSLAGAFRRCLRIVAGVGAMAGSGGRLRNGLVFVCVAVKRASRDLLDQRVDDRRVELRASCFLELGERPRLRKRRSVGTMLGHRAKGVAGGHHARRERNTLAAESVRVAGPVGALMMQLDDGRDSLEP